MISIILCLLSFASGKLVKSTVKMTPEVPVAYLTRFATDPGKSTFMFKSRISRGSDSTYEDRKVIYLNIYTEKEWDGGQHACREDESHKKIKLELPGDGAWAKRVYDALESIGKSEVWYFTLSDCEGIFKQETRIRFDLDIKNTDEGHFSSEHSGMMAGYVAIGMVFFFLALTTFNKLFKVYKSKEIYDSNLMILIASILLHIGFIIARLADFQLVDTHGFGHNMVQYVSTNCEFLSQLAIMFVFLIVSDGWSLFSVDFPSPELYIPGMLMFGSFEFIATGIGRLLEDAHYKYTDHDGPAGYYHIGLRVLFLFWFLYNCKSLKNESKTEANVQKKFKTIGIFYFLSLPIFIGLSKFLPGHLRYRMVMVGLNVIQLFVTVYLYLLFSLDRAKARIIASEDILPPKRHDN